MKKILAFICVAPMMLFMAAYICLHYAISVANKCIYPLAMFMVKIGDELFEWADK